MKYTYKILETTNIDSSVTKIIYRLEDNAFIPMDETNPDYQAYLNRDNPDYGNKL